MATVFISYCNGRMLGVYSLLPVPSIPLMTFYFGTVAVTLSATNITSDFLAVLFWSMAFRSLALIVSLNFF
ncbi:MAG: hypothetical protein EXX96DRAFT_566669 [Benjaminiella poitrasii]|nr:MAG: hypothetical protein EXX96DRAFT_566669 [Benjaminiella poitrasii]